MSERVIYEGTDAYGDETLKVVEGQAVVPHLEIQGAAWPPWAGPDDEALDFSHVLGRVEVCRLYEALGDWLAR